jgi:hypothetical protein
MGASGKFAAAALERVGPLVLMVVFGLSLERPAKAAPEAHILRIDPRAGLNSGKPLLTTVIEVVDFKRLNDALEPCSNRRNPLGAVPVSRAACAPFG